MKQEFCQSCGMPMSAEHFSTNQDGSTNTEYCSYCFKDGNFTQDVDMNGMITACAEYADQWQTEDGHKVTKEEAIAQMKEFFPMLKRWKN